MNHKQLLFVISGPSGAGKETVIGAMTERLPALRRVTTYTTRQPRAGERPGHHYHFVSEAEFESLVARGELFESEAVYGSSRYGSPRLAVAGTDSGDLIMELDPNGFRRIRAARSAPTVGIFLLVPKARELAARITARSEELDLAARLAIVRAQLAACEDYDYLVANDEREACLTLVAAILAAERAKRDGPARLAQVRREFEA